MGGSTSFENGPKLSKRLSHNVGPRLGQNLVQVSLRNIIGPRFDSTNGNFCQFSSVCPALTLPSEGRIFLEQTKKEQTKFGPSLELPNRPFWDQMVTFTACDTVYIYIHTRI